MLKFKKMHGLGNDFIVIDCRDGTPLLNPEKIRDLANRKTGIGFDQVVHMLPPKSTEADIYLDMSNADGGPVEACGNATRCIAKLMHEETGKKKITIETIVGLLHCTVAESGMVTVDMGPPIWEWDKIPLAYACDPLCVPINKDFNPSPASLHSAPTPIGRGKRAISEWGEGIQDCPVAVSIGNPHCVFFVEDAEKVELETLGPRYEHDPLFPNRVNVEFVHKIADNHLRMRVWERGTGITQACGTGACAVMVAAHARGMVGRHAIITLDGGDLNFELRKKDNHILMTGPATFVYEGTIDVD